MLWVKYGLLQGDAVVTAVNSCGFVLNAYYLYTSYIYAPFSVRLVIPASAYAVALPGREGLLGRQTLTPVHHPTALQRPYLVPVTMAAVVVYGSLGYVKFVVPTFAAVRTLQRGNRSLASWHAPSSHVCAAPSALPGGTFHGLGCCPLLHRHVCEPSVRDGRHSCACVARASLAAWHPHPHPHPCPFLSCRVCLAHDPAVLFVCTTPFPLLLP